MSSNSTSENSHGGSGSIVQRSYHDESNGSLSTSVIVALDSLPEFAVETREGALFDRLDPDALDSLFRSTEDSNRTDGRVVFPIGSHVVTVWADGEIVIRRRPSAAE